MEQALFIQARRRRRRRWLAGIAAVLVGSAVVTVVIVTWPHRASGQDADRPGVAGTGLAARSSGGAAVWYDGIHLRVGSVHPDGQVIQRAGPEVNADLLPLVPAGGRIYWVNPMGGAVPFMPYRAWYPKIVQYLDRATGKIGIAGPGSTAFLSANGRYLLMAQDATTLGELPVAGGALRQLTLPPGWYLPGGDGLPGLDYPGLATANGVIVQSRESGESYPQVFGLWNPGSHTVRVLGRALAIIAAYTPPGARSSLLAWLPAACPFPDNCLLNITSTATLATRTVRSPMPGGFAIGGAFSPDGTQLAVFPQTLPHGMAPAYARLALVVPRTGAVRVAPRPRITLGEDLGWALWLPDGRHLIVGPCPGSCLVESATLSARPLFLAPSRGHHVSNGLDVNFTAAMLSPGP
ncbi:MAG TPA: hypothetical protein VIX86_19635 [Streptosporangiaceae bacterium]